MKIFKGWHYGWPFPCPKFYFNKTNYSKSILLQFDESIRYNIGEDQNDVNKLFGFSYGWHHVNSDRIGFRYNIERDQVEIVLYAYVNGKRIATQHIEYVNINERVSITLNVNRLNGKRKIDISVNTICVARNIDDCDSKWGYTLGLYFGGNKRAPHTIHIKTFK